MNKEKVSKETIDSLNSYSWDNRYSSYEEALSHAERAMVFAEDINYERGQAYASLNLAACFFLKSNNEDAFPLLQQCLNYFNNHQEEEGYVNTLIHIANIYESYGDYEKALNNVQEALIKAKDSRYDEGEGDALAVLGLVYTRLGDYVSAQKAYAECLSIRKKTGKQNAIASSLNRLAQSYCLAGEYNKALEYYSLSREIREKIEKHSGIAWTYLGMASTYEYMSKLDEANKYYSLGADHKESDIRCRAQCLTGSGRINRKLRKLDTAKKELHEAEKTALKLNAKPLLIDVYLELAKYYEKIKNDSKALDYYKKYDNTKEEVLSTEAGNRLKNQQIVFAIEKSEKEKEIFQLRNVELNAAYDEIHEKNKEITDSIEYALRIQSAMLPRDSYLKEILPLHFILYLPRDIVSGDFYWAGSIKDKTVAVAADCTGHGVPGAFMSMLGMSFLDDIVNKNHTSEPSRIISSLREKVVKALKQKDVDVDSQDGMDISVCVFDKASSSLTFAGAYNSLCLVRDGELSVYKADRMPVGISTKMEEKFTSHNIDLRKGDRLYMYSDGYQDQFGGGSGKKLKSSAFKQLLLDTSGLSLNGQKAALLDYFKAWKGEYPQIDDVIVIGFEY